MPGMSVRDKQLLVTKLSKLMGNTVVIDNSRSSCGSCCYNLVNRDTECPDCGVEFWFSLSTHLGDDAAREARAARPDLHYLGAGVIDHLDFPAAKIRELSMG